ncbi:helix-turn-helix domain-containing protein [Pseudooceanicola lipolyticus]|uniref:helix-turn-helix domain-containing protein n=1 Tax=Pseudooceanicola lipolyticus TaxID=2029104 RepID=UPI0010550896
MKAGRCSRRERNRLAGYAPPSNATSVRNQRAIHWGASGPGAANAELGSQERRRIKRWRQAKVAVPKVAQALRRPKARIHRELTRNFFPVACLSNRDGR